MTDDMKEVEAARARFRPAKITTLFVGESAPISGDFFYYGNNAMLSHMQRAVEQALGERDDFLERFKAYGWYLDDLVLTPVNHLKNPERKAQCQSAQPSLTARIAEYQPLAIVSLMVGIKHIVEAAAVAAGNNSPRFAVPFPGMGQQVRFLAAMAGIIPTLPRLPGAS